MVNIISSWKTFKILLRTAWSSLIDMRSFLVLLVLYLVIISVFGMQLFAYKVIFHKETGKPMPKGAT